VTTQRQIRLEPLLQRGQPQLLELGDRQLRERLIAEIRQRCTSPHRQPGSQRAGGLLRVPSGKLLASALEQTPEPVDIQLPGLDAKHITSPPRRQQTIRRPSSTSVVSEYPTSEVMRRASSAKCTTRHGGRLLIGYVDDHNCG
jgi:hypothetical protein